MDNLATFFWKPWKWIDKAESSGAFILLHKLITNKFLWWLHHVEDPFIDTPCCATTDLTWDLCQPWVYAIFTEWDIQVCLFAYVGWWIARVKQAIREGAFPFIIPQRLFPVSYNKWLPQKSTLNLTSSSSHLASSFERKCIVLQQSASGIQINIFCVERLPWLCGELLQSQPWLCLALMYPWPEGTSWVKFQCLAVISLFNKINMSKRSDGISPRSVT